MDIGGSLPCAGTDQQGNILLHQNLLISSKIVFLLFLVSCTAGLLEPGHISFSWRALFRVNSQYCEYWSHSTVATSTSLSVRSFEVKILSIAERSLQNNSSEEMNCCRNNPVHQRVSSGCLIESSAPCPFSPLFCGTLFVKRGSYRLFSWCLY